VNEVVDDLLLSIDWNRCDDEQVMAHPRLLVVYRRVISRHNAALFELVDTIGDHTRRDTDLFPNGVCRIIPGILLQEIQDTFVYRVKFLRGHGQGPYGSYQQVGSLDSLSTDYSRGSELLYDRES
jgi:hypothetical protein